MADKIVARHLEEAVRIRRLEDVDLSASLKDKETYEKALKRLEKALLSVQQAYLLHDHRAVLVFEGWDAAGKGGAIRRLSAALDPRFCRVWPIGAPNEVEKAMPYLHRFWERLPLPGSLAVFDRSWYGRVLVERVEGLTPAAEWKRAYDEINAFEEMLERDGIRIVKILLHLSAEEQLARLAERLHNPNKRWKLSRADFESRKFREPYIHAYEDMLERCSPKERPWHVISGEHKWLARIACLQAIVDALERDVDLAPPAIDPTIRANALAAGVPEEKLPPEEA